MIDDVNPHRLPRTVLPRRYDLRLTPDLPSATFVGAVDVDVEVHSATEVVVLNAIELEVHEARILQGGVEHQASVTYDTETERVTLQLGSALVPGPAVVSLQFTGVLNDKLRGFYRSTFTDDAGVEHGIATTQFEATDARRAFPCWDEPDCKATFAITLDVDPGLMAVSNGAVLEASELDGRTRVRFAETMAMSTYLVAFVVGPMEATAPVEIDGTPLRIVHAPGKGHLTGLSAEVGAFALRYLADYFALPYAGDSMDLVAIPDFAFGAMENVGCVTFRETLLLADPATTTQGEQQNLVDVVAHELAHMWFGNLVTMRWWNGIWLNEAFATFMEMKVTDAFRPEWERWVSFGLSRTQAFDTDALEATRPIEYPVISPADAEGMFDILTYEKGAAVVRMLEQFLGEEPFREGIRRYMRAHAYGNTETTDLWDAVEGATGKPVRRIMDSWIFQGGHPLVRIDLAADDRVLQLTQQRFRYTPAAEDPARWAIPMQLRYGTVSGAVVETSALFDGDRLEIDLPEPATWVVGNAHGHGFYRVRMSGELRDRLVRQAGTVLSDIERYGLVDDTWTSVLAGDTTVGSFVALAEGFSGETDVSVWRRILGALTEIDGVLAPQDRPAFHHRVGAMVRPALDRLGWEPATTDSDRDRELRGALIAALAALAGDTDAIERCRALFGKIRAGEAVEANVVGAVLRTIATVARPGDLDELEAGFRTGATPQEEQRYLFSMAQVRDPELFDRVLTLATSSAVRSQNAPYLLAACIANRDNGAAAWATVERNWEEINERFPSNSIPRMLNATASVSDPRLAEAIESFLAGHPVAQGRRTVAQALERMRVSVGLRNRVANG